MSSKGGYTAVPPPRQGVERFYNPPAVRRHQQILLQQQLLQRQQLLHQQQHQQQQQQQQQHHQLLRRRAAWMQQESSSEAAPEQRGDVRDAAAPAALYVPRPFAPAMDTNVTNLDRLMESVSPFIRASFSPEVLPRQNRDTDLQPFFMLEDLWESFNEWSVYGAEVPLVLNGKHTIQQYYVPFLSGIQLFVDPSKHPSRFRGSFEEIDSESHIQTNIAHTTDTEGDRRSASYLNSNRSIPGDKSVLGSSTSGTKVTKSPGVPLFQFLEYEQPYNRRPLTDKINLLVSKQPELSKFKSCDLLPSSWISVAWYPIYRIPVGPTLQDLDACFLTFHSLSTQPSARPHKFHAANTRTVKGGAVDPNAKISLPVFALASYKLKGSIVSPSGPHECEQESVLLQTADTWLRSLQVVLPDYQFFRAHYSPWR